MSIVSSLRTVKGYIGELIGKLSGAEKRRAAAKIAIMYDEPGSQTFAAEASGMSRNTIYKGIQRAQKMYNNTQLSHQKSTHKRHKIGICRV